MLEGKLFLELVNDIVYKVSLGEGEDPSTVRVEFVNQRVKEITGYEPEDFIRNPHLWIQVVHPEDREKVKELATELVREKRSVLREYRVRTAEGKYIWVEDRVIPVIEGGRVVEFVGSARDITMKKAFVELSFLALEGRLKELSEGAVQWIAQILGADLVAIYDLECGLRAGYGVDGGIRLEEGALPPGFKGGLCLQLERYGALHIYFREERRLSEGELEFLRSLAGMVGLAIGKNRNERKLERSSRLYRVISIVVDNILKGGDREGFLREVGRVLVSEAGFRGALVGLLEGGELKVVSSCGDSGELLQRVREDGIYLWEEVVVRDTCAAVPIRYEGRAIGTIGLCAPEEGFFDRNTVALLRVLGDEVGFGLEFLERTERLRMFYLAVEQTSDWVVITDRDGVIQYANRAVQEMSGYEARELIGKKTNVFRSEMHTQDFYRRLWETILSGRTFRVMFINRRKDGELFYLDQTITPLKDSEGKVVAFVSTGKDITRERELRERIYYITLYDPVTDLPNRNSFMERVSFHIARSKATNRLFALVLTDIDSFKRINDIYGYQVGDRVLREVGKRLRDALRPGDTVARLGSDEFGLVLADMASREDIPGVLTRLVKALEEPISLDGIELRLKFKMGISLFPGDGEDPEELLRKAEIALSHVEAPSLSPYQFFREEMNARLIEFTLMEKHLSEALRKGEYVLYYQPIYDLGSLKVHAFEALLRWNSEDLGMVPPSKFIPILERTGLIIEVGEWVLREVVRRIEEWKVPISVNVSPVQLRDKSFLSKVREVLSWSAVRGGELVLEITESTAMENVDFAKKILTELKELGVSVAIDDFGTGYSSIAYLKLLPIDILKIDRSFVFDVDKDPKDRAIVGAIIQMAKALGLRTTAEGIEKEEHLRILRDLGCECGQGYFLSKPLPEGEVLRVLGI